MRICPTPPSRPTAMRPARSRMSGEIHTKGSAKPEISVQERVKVKATEALVSVRPSLRSTIMVTAKNTVPSRSEEHTSELQSLMRISYAVFCLKKKKKNTRRQVAHEYST